MRLRLVVGVVATAALCVGATIAFSAVDAVKSTVEITEGGPTEFKGVVTSSESACVKGRDVSLVYDTAGAVVGEDTTNKKGKWKMPGSYTAGQYHAEVAEKTVAKKSRCKADRSKRKRY